MTDIFLSVCGATEAGRVRSNNEDAFAVADITSGQFIDVSMIRTRIDVGARGVLLLVSDGMGGEKAGEVASALSIESICDHLASTAADADVGEALRSAVEHANERVLAAANDAQRRGMGATMCAVLIQGDTAYTAEVGDSRAYVFREGELTPITKDQTYVQMLIDRGISPEAMRTSQAKNVILQAIGKQPELVVAQRRLALRQDDRLLLCSDGLFTELADDEIREVLASSSILGEACMQLMEIANDHGGRDNLTVLLADVRGDLPPPREGESVSAALVTLRAFVVGEG